MKIKRCIALGVLAALLGDFGIVADQVSEGETLKFDNAVLMALRVPGDPANPIGPSWLPEAARDVTALGSFAVLTILVVGVVAVLTLVGNRRTALFLTVSVLGGTIVSTVLKILFDRPRPDLTGVPRSLPRVSRAGTPPSPPSSTLRSAPFWPKSPRPDVSRSSSFSPRRS